MIQVLKAPSSWASDFAKSFVEGGTEGYFSEREKQEKLNKEKANTEALNRLTGEDYSGLQPEFQKLAFTEKLRGQQEKAKGEAKENEKAQPIIAGLEALNKMRQIRNKGNLGLMSGVTGIFNPEVRKDRGEYEQFGKSLISLSTNIPIRNKLEFETLSEKLYDPSLTDAEAEGVLNAMEKILMGQLPQDKMVSKGIEQTEAPREKPSLKSFYK